MSNERPTTTGEAIIGTFNPDDRPDVAEIKKAAIDFIDMLNITCPQGRRQHIAITHVEQAAMMAVKSLFNGA